MDSVKRKSPIDYLSKKFRNESHRSINYIEHMSNECFFEIFDYLDGYVIYEAFSNLNSRFQQLLHSSTLLYKIKLDISTPEGIFEKNYSQIIGRHQPQILSIHLLMKNAMFPATSLFIVISQCMHLESLVLYNIRAHLLHSLLKNLTKLPCLFLLKVNTHNSFTLQEISDTYQFTFALPKLKYFEFDTDTYDTTNLILPLSIATHQQFSHITCFCIGQSCSYKELFPIISYTPELYRLKLSYAVYDDEPDIENVLKISLKNLKYLSFERFEMEFNELKLFMKKILIPKLEFLRVNVEYNDIVCFNANHWEELICKNFPHLKKFYLKYPEDYHRECVILKNSTQLKQFFSSFWIERQWLLNIEINDSSIIYAIHSSTQNDVINSSIQFILISDNYSDEFCIFLKSAIDYLSPTIGQIYDLEISDISLNRFIQILNFLPKLNSLKISSLSLKQFKCLSNDEKERLNFITNQNQIRKIILEQMNDIEEIIFLLEHFTQMTYLKIDSINTLHMELFLRIILLKIQTKPNHQLKLLSFYISAADDKMIETLQTMIDFEKLLFNYTIKRSMENIILEWT
ncbi:unnamed protein product [Adineta steineri]|uniref:F-box domain-containing protein n=1 Tax=Adineta steineri TaxID=433720 RepID=A0A815H5H1_9BILA|nr:unnamed protein product [Adineta steineri]CAF1349737.1 unnamed protein product [Adineta steineri]